jgi:hypothetical protein
MREKDSELFNPLVATGEKYLRDDCDGKQQDDEKAQLGLKKLNLIPSERVWGNPP